MKNMLRNVLIISLILIIGVMFFNPIKVQAKTVGDNFISDIGDGVDKFKEMGENKMGKMNISTNAIEPVLAIAQVLYFIGCVVVIIGTIYFGFQYGRSSPENKATIKRKLIGWLITSIILIGAVAVWNLVISLFE